MRVFLDTNVIVIAVTTKFRSGRAMMRDARILRIAFGAFLLSCSSVRADIIRWVDENGTPHFSDRPPSHLASPAASARTPTADRLTRSYELPGRGVLLLNVPESWGQQVRRPAADLPPTIVFRPAQGDDFEVLVTPLWSPQGKPGFNSPEQVKRLVAGDLAGMLPGAVEKEVALQPLEGKYGGGYSFLVTDKVPGRGYPYAVRAGVGVGDLLLSVTVLARSKDSEGIAQTLQALREAVHRK